MRSGKHRCTKPVSVLQKRKEERQLDLGKDSLATAKGRLGGLFLRERMRGAGV